MSESVAAERSRLVTTGVGPLDERLGGLEPGGSYLIVGAPGPAKMVAALHFVAEGASRGEPSVLLTGADARGIIEVGAAWGIDLAAPWRAGILQIVGFKDDFDLRAARSLEPQEVLEELSSLQRDGVRRIAVDPGSMFLAGGTKTLLGGAYLRWARDAEATVCTTFSVDGDANNLPSSADWLIHATTGRMVVERRGQDLFQIEMVRSIPDGTERNETVSLQLKPGAGLIRPESRPTRRKADRGDVDPDRLLLVSLGESHSPDLEAWVASAFESSTVSDPFEAVARVQDEGRYGAVLIYAARTKVREAVRACRAIRPLTHAAIIFASDDAVRSTDRVAVLEAGADDCLSGGLDFRELGLRIRQAVASGTRAAVVEGDETQAGASAMRPGGVVGMAAFRAEMDRRAGDPASAVFCVISVEAPGVEDGELAEVLAREMRDEDGDLLATRGGRGVVLLQGARGSQADPFISRLKGRLREAAKKGGSRLKTEVLSHPAERERIRTFLGEADAEEG